MEVQAQKAQWELLDHRGLLVCPVHMVLQDLREALDSLVSKVNLEMSVFLGLKEKLDLKENKVLQEHKDRLGLKEKRESVGLEEILDL